MNSLQIEQKQALSTTQLQSLKVLSLTNQELESFLTEEYLENPLLDCSRDLETTMLNDLESLYEKGISYKDHYNTAKDPFDDSDRTGDIRAREDDSVTALLMGQLDLHRYDTRTIELFRYLIRCLDEKGFFHLTAGEIASATRYTEEETAACLKVLKTLEPAGVFAADIPECLILQLQRKGIEDPVLFRMLTECMEDVLAGRIGNVTRTLGITTAQVKEYMHLISTLDPRPFMNVDRDDVRYIVPDILAEYRDGSWIVSLNDNWMGEYKYDDYYISMMQTVTDPELKAYFREKMQRARFVIDSIAQRRRTILRVTEEILDIQSAHFLVNAPLKPMTLNDIAERTGMHPSTVSRAIQGKYLQYRGAVLMKQLFTQSASSSNPDATADRIRRRIEGLIREEDSKHPLSDARLVSLLKDEGITVSRRTVTKYRMQLGIPDSRARHNFTTSPDFL